MNTNTTTDNKTNTILIKPQRKKRGTPWTEEDIERKKEQARKAGTKHRNNNIEARRKATREYNSVKIRCECGMEIQRGYRTRHVKTSKHKIIMETIERLNKTRI